jgi:hypothetical protein
MFQKFHGLIMILVYRDVRLNVFSVTVNMYENLLTTTSFLKQTKIYIIYITMYRIGVYCHIFEEVNIIMNDLHIQNLISPFCGLVFFFTLKPLFAPLRYSSMLI